MDVYESTNDSTLTRNSFMTTDLTSVLLDTLRTLLHSSECISANRLQHTRYSDKERVTYSTVAPIIQEQISMNLLPFFNSWLSPYHSSTLSCSIEPSSMELRMYHCGDYKKIHKSLPQESSSLTQQYTVYICLDSNLDISEELRRRHHWFSGSCCIYASPSNVLEDNEKQITQDNISVIRRRISQKYRSHTLFPHEFVTIHKPGHVLLFRNDMSHKIRHIFGNLETTYNLLLTFTLTVTHNTPIQYPPPLIYQCTCIRCQPYLYMTVRKYASFFLSPTLLWSIIMLCRKQKLSEDLEYTLYSWIIQYPLPECTCTWRNQKKPEKYGVHLCRCMCTPCIYETRCILNMRCGYERNYPSYIRIDYEQPPQSTVDI